MSNSQTCHLEPTTKAYVKLQWQIIEKLFLRIDELTSEELHVLDEAKNKLVYIMNTGEIADKTEYPDMISMLVKKQKESFLFSKEELSFIYGVSKPEGYETMTIGDVRVKNIKAERLKQRTIQEEFAFIFDCKPSQVVLNESEITKDSRVFAGDSLLLRSNEPPPVFLQHVSGLVVLSLRSGEKFKKDMLLWLMRINKIDVLKRKIEEFEIMDKETATLLEKKGLIDLIANHLKMFESFEPQTAQVVREKLQAQLRWDTLLKERTKLQIVTEKQVRDLISHLIASGGASTILSHLKNLPRAYVDKMAICHQLIKEKAISHFFAHFEALQLNELEKQKLSQAMLDTKDGTVIGELVIQRKKFKEQELHILNEVLEQNGAKILVEKVDNFPENFENFQEIANQLMASGDSILLATHLKKFRKKINFAPILQDLLQKKERKRLEEATEHMAELPPEVAEQLVKDGEWEFVGKHARIFRQLSPECASFVIKNCVTKEETENADVSSIYSISNIVERTHNLPSDMAEYLLEHQVTQILYYLDHFKELSKKTVISIVRSNGTRYLIMHLDRCKLETQKDVHEVIESIIAYGDFDTLGRRKDELPKEWIEDESFVREFRIMKAREDLRKARLNKQ